MSFADLQRAWDELTAPGAQFEVEEVDARGVRCPSFRMAPATLRDLWVDAATRFADRPYLVFEDERLTYRDAFQLSQRIGAWMQAQGIGKGDRVVIAMRNYPEWMLIYWAGAMIGATICGFNAWWSASEMANMLAVVRPKLAFVDAERLRHARRYREAMADRTLIAVRTPAIPAGTVAWREVVAHPPRVSLPVLQPDDDVCIFFTSGTSGTSKGAVLTHRGCVTNILNILFAGEVQAAAAPGTTKPAQPAAPIALVTTPLFHVTANNCCAQVATVLGGAVILMYKWDAGAALDLIEREGVTIVSGTPVMHREIVLHPRFATARLDSLTAFSGGGASLPPDILARIDSSRLTARASSGYGMTEASGVVCSIAGDFFAAKPTSCGRVLPAFDYRVVDDDGKDIAPGGSGELWLRGAAVIPGYLDADGVAVEPLVDGWLRTGDIVTVDADRFIHIVDRKKDIILRGGENIACVEVEAAIYELDPVAECAVFAIPDERLGEAVAAAVYPHPDALVSAADVVAHCARRLAAYKVPARVWMLHQPIPRNASGKLVKRDLVRDLLRSAGVR